MRRGAGQFLESEIGKRLPVLKEQLMVYFVFTYFCGAVYNGNPYGKMKMAATATLLIEELAQALWTDQGGRSYFFGFCGWGPPVFPGGGTLGFQ